MMDEGNVTGRSVSVGDDARSGNRLLFQRIGRVLPSTPAGAFWLSLLACLAGCSLLVGLAPLIWSSRSFSVYGQDGYFEIARSLVQGHGFVFEAGGEPTHHRAPLYPLVLAPLAMLPPPWLFPALVILHSLMVGWIGGLVFSLARRAFDLDTARLALLVLLANPWLYSNALNPLTPVLQGLLYPLFVCAILVELLPHLASRSVETPARGTPWLLIGGLGGLLSLTHGTLIATNAAALLLLFLLALRRRDRTLRRTAVLAALVSTLMVAPWTYRNWVTFDRFIPVVGGAAAMYFNQYAYWASEDPLGEADDQIRHQVSDPSSWDFHGVTTSKLEAQLSQEALRLAADRPDRLFLGVALNAAAYYFPTVADSVRGDIRLSNSDYDEKRLLTALHFTLWLLAIMGLWHVRRRRRYRTPALLLLLSIPLYAVWYFPFHTSVAHTMYTFATMPTLAILAALGLTMSRKRLT